MPILVQKETALSHLHQPISCKHSRHSGPRHHFQVHPYFSILLILLQVVTAAMHCEYLVHLTSLAPGQAILPYHTAFAAVLYHSLLHMEYHLRSHSFDKDFQFLLQVDHSAH